ncbi:CatB-related O-acetyltransferase [Leisingera aquaemixtae]|uniref:CatB-related O-acetyltransferase n=1 Tax=Leisingera aquaemixtae TaxID=1396826 RepID=A0ABY5WP05_9RHOB|nr:CatB-related O-acetyltransferase [Leisingera aquaemixtae]UWQ43269.1 CatB-related O-acetyltransferase [Leisingera aquaemixtae]
MVTPENPKTAPIGHGQLDIGRFTHGYEELDIQEQGVGANVSIGAFCSIGRGMRILLDASPMLDRITAFPFGEVFIEELGGAGVHVPRQNGGDVVIGNDVWIGANATVLAGVTIGNGAVIGPNATVASDVGAYEVWAGNPAQRVRKRFDDAVCEKLQELRWWDLPLPLIREMAPLLSAQPTVELLEGLQGIVADLVTFTDQGADENAA